MGLKMLALTFRRPRGFAGAHTLLEIVFAIGVLILAILGVAITLTATQDATRVSEDTIAASNRAERLMEFYLSQGFGDLEADYNSGATIGANLKQLPPVQITDMGLPAGQENIGLVTLQGFDVNTDGAFDMFEITVSLNYNGGGGRPPFSATLVSRKGNQ